MFVSVSDLITYPESWYAFLSQALLLKDESTEHTFQLAGQGLSGMATMQCVWEEAARSWCGSEACCHSSHPVKTAIIISPAAAMGVQAWELRTFPGNFSQLLITGNNYKFLVSTHFGTTGCPWEAFSFTEVPEGDGLTRKKCWNHTLGTDTNHLHPSGFFTSWDASLPILTFFTFNHWMEPSMKVLVKEMEWNKLPGKYIQRDKEKEDIIKNSWGEPLAQHINLDSFSNPKPIIMEIL